MIRFIDLGKQIGLDEEWPREFAFYNTITDSFIGCVGKQVWSCWADFESDMLVHDMERFKNLCPEWVFNAER